ncbi:hypothetical protein SmJEL517_g04068 [Synchytrium microbalum]|uniref:Peptidase C14 caspase domain-containing protein n=1 Tax=Synchytrium microbalum TaxID=1806994 RepID=A0A507BZN9_9FUNG|nr:uncharacterized protein SmJEL517_g04068 [Synchytrium microbalum]TPX32902.1 hypothetical protein SmJEL517_g04068 [Synchytrium microbalum]
MSFFSKLVQELEEPASDEQGDGQRGMGGGLGNLISEFAGGQGQGQQQSGGGLGALMQQFEGGSQGQQGGGGGMGALMSQFAGGQGQQQGGGGLGALMSQFAGGQGGQQQSVGGGGLGALMNEFSGGGQQQQQSSGGLGNMGALMGALSGHQGGSGGNPMASMGGMGALGSLAGMAGMAGMMGGGGGQSGAQSGDATTGNPMLDSLVEKAFGGQGNTSKEDDPRHKAGYNAQFLQPQDLHGKRRALFIGINYTGSSHALQGCINDVNNVKTFVFGHYKIDQFMVLTDDQTDPHKQPTRANILGAFQWLASGAQPGDSFFLHYSGHGSQTKDLDGDEAIGMDSTMVPVDYETAGMILDDDINTLMVQPLPAGCQFVSVLDCCHSESLLDLPYIYTLNGNLEVEVRDTRVEGAKKLVAAGIDFLRGNKTRAFGDAKDGVMMFLSKDASSEEKQAAIQKTQKEKGSRATIYSLSGCLDEQTSADAHLGGSPTGAMSYALLQVLNKTPQITYLELLKQVRGILQGQFQQIPQLSTGFPTNINAPFFL